MAGFSGLRTEVHLLASFTKLFREKVWIKKLHFFIAKTVKKALGRLWRAAFHLAQSAHYPLPLVTWRLNRRIDPTLPKHTPEKSQAF